MTLLSLNLRHHVTMNTDTTDLTHILRRKTRVELLMMACGVFAFAWIPPALILISGDGELRPVFRTLWQLWPLAVVPLCGLVICWCWRSSLKHQLKELDSNEKHRAASK